MKRFRDFALFLALIISVIGIGLSIGFSIANYGSTHGAYYECGEPRR